LYQRPLNQQKKFRERETPNSTDAIRRRNIQPRPKLNKDIEKKSQEINLEEKVEKLKKELEHFKVTTFDERS